MYINKMALEFIYNQYDENSKEGSKFGSFIKYVNTLNYEGFSDNGYGQFLHIDILESTYNDEQDKKRKKRSLQYISTLDVIPEKSKVVYSTKINKIVSRKSISSNLSAMENVIKDTEEKEEEKEKSTDLLSVVSVIIIACIACGIIVSL